METTMRKLQQRYRRVIEEMEKWDEQQAVLLSSFTNASSIIDRLEVLGASKNYGSLQNVIGIKEALLAKQLESLETYFCQMRDTLKEFHGIVKSLDKIARDANQLVKSGSSPTSKQMQLRVGTWSSLKDCLVGLRSISEMHQADKRKKNMHTRGCFCFQYPITLDSLTTSGGLLCYDLAETMHEFSHLCVRKSPESVNT